jgi:WD40 repeat protein
MLTLALGSSGVGPHVVRHIVAAEPSPKIVHRLGKPRLYHTDSTRVGNPHIGGDSPTVQLAFSPDGKLLASGYGHVVDIWDAQTGALIREIRLADYYGGWRTAAFSADSQDVYTATEEHVLAFRARTGHRILHREFEHPFMQPRIYCAADGKTVQVVAGNPPQLGRSWSTETGVLVDQWQEDREHSTRILAVSPDLTVYAEHLPNSEAIPAISPQVRICRMKSGEELFRMPAPVPPPREKGDDEFAVDFQDSPLVVLFSPDATTFALFVPEAPIEVWSVKEQKHLATIKSSEQVRGVVYATNQSLVLLEDETLSGIKALEVWDLRANRRQRRVELSVALQCYQFLGSPVVACGNQVAVANELRIQLVDTTTGEVRPRGSRYESAEIVTCIFDLPKKQVLTSRASGVKQVWSLSTGSPTVSLPVDGGVGVSFSPDGSRLYRLQTTHEIDPEDDSVLRRSTKKIEVWDTHARKVVGTLELPEGDASTFSADGRMVFARANAGLLAFDLTGAPQPKLLWASPVGPAYLWPGNDKLIAANESSQIWIDTATGKVTRTFHENIPGQLISVSGNGLRVAHHTEDGVAVISLVPKQGSDRPGTLLQRDLDDEGFRYLSLLSAALSPDGKLLACAPRTGLDVWEVDTGRHLRIAEAERFVKFSHDGSLLTAGGRGNTVLIYDVSSLVECLKP